MTIQRHTAEHRTLYALDCVGARTHHDIDQNLKRLGYHRLLPDSVTGTVRLEQEGLVRSRWSLIGTPRRRVYDITPEGVMALAALGVPRRAWRDRLITRLVRAWGQLTSNTKGY